MLIKCARRRGVVEGIKNNSPLIISHILFMDDTMIFGQGSIRKMNIIKEILDICYKATRIEINMVKSTLLFHETIKEVKS